jgi:hypothetical protein
LLQHLLLLPIRNRRQKLLLRSQRLPIPLSLQRRVLPLYLLINYPTSHVLVDLPLLLLGPVSKKLTLTRLSECLAHQRVCPFMGYTDFRDVMRLLSLELRRIELLNRLHVVRPLPAFLHPPLLLLPLLLFNYLQHHLQLRY